MRPLSRWQLCRRATLDLPDSASLALIISDDIGWIQWIDAAGGLKAHLSHIIVVKPVISCPGSSVDLLCTSSLYIAHMQDVSGIVDPLLFRLRSIDIVIVDLISDELWWSRWLMLNFLQLILWVEGICWRPLRLELLALRSREGNVSIREVVLRFIEL